MDRAFEQISVEFTIKAQNLFISTYERFRLSVKKLDRQRDENVFQLQLGKYVVTLRSHLESIAYDLLAKNKEIKHSDRFNRVLRNQVNIYLIEFRQKARLL